MTDAYHEPREQLRQETIERHRALRSIIEELEAVDWYDQRVDASQDEELRAVLAHSRDEEKEHASMTLEWLRRHDAVLDANLRKYLFADERGEPARGADLHGGGPCSRPTGDERRRAARGGSPGRADDGVSPVAIEDGEAGQAGDAARAEGSLGIGSLRGRAA